MLESDSNQQPCKTLDNKNRGQTLQTYSPILQPNIRDKVYLLKFFWNNNNMFAVVVCVSECPLTLAVQLEESCELIKVLRSGGAHLDFRTRDGITALHRAVLCRNSSSLTVRKLHLHKTGPKHRVGK